MRKSVLLLLAFCASLISQAQIITTYAGNGSWGYTGDGIPATAAPLGQPLYIATDNAGNVYIADYYNHRIRKVNTSGIITTVAGTGTHGFSGDGGPATAAQISYPIAVAVDATGNLYISDQDNSRIRKVNTSGIISTIAGTGWFFTGGDGGPATAASFNYTGSITLDGAGNIYVQDYACVRKISTSGIITTCAGGSTFGYGGDGGPATAALLSANGIVADATGNLYITDCNNFRIRKVNTSGIITTIAGTGVNGYTGNGGPATAAQISTPFGPALDASGNLYFSDRLNYCIRKISSGIITQVAGNDTPGYRGDGGPATAARLYLPLSVATAGGGVFYFIDTAGTRIRRVGPAVTGVTFDGGSSQHLTICENSGANSINTLLTVTDATSGLTETYSVTTSPSHGSITTGSTVGSGTSVLPSGWAYTPATGYTGTDSFTVQVSDGLTTATTVIHVAVNPLPAAISGTASICPGSPATYTDPTSGGTWSSSNTAIVTIGSTSGIATGVATGIATITYTSPAHCYATLTVTVGGGPAVYAMTGGGVYCSFGAPVTVGLSNSQTGVSYQLYRSGTAVGSPVSGTGSAFSFGMFTTAGTYTCIANPTSACPATMSGSASVTVSTSTTLPALITVGGGGSFCAGGTGVPVTLPASSAGIDYQLYRNGILTGSPLAGTGTALSFGLQVLAGTYTVIATNMTTGCSRVMTGSANVTQYPAPNTYSVTGGGRYCAGGAGAVIGLSNSQVGVSYKLYLGTAPVGSAHTGTGAAISFGYVTAAGTYTVLATNSTTFCTATMTGSSTVSITPAPTITGSIYTVAPGATITLTGTPTGGTWACSAPAVATVGSSSGIVTGITLGTDVITYTAAGCTGTHTIYVTATGHRSNGTGTGGEKNITIIPNPNHGTFTVSGSLGNTGEETVTLELINMLGQVVYTDKFTATDGQINREILLPNIAAGTYLLSLRTSDDRQVFHVVVQDK